MAKGQAKVDHIKCSYSKLVAVDELLKLKHPKNMNAHPFKQIERLAKIMEYQGVRYPIKVSKLSGYITSGHGRLEAAKLLKWKEMPVDFQDYEDDKQEYADIVADNAIASWAELDLSQINSDIIDFGPELDLEMLGLENFAIDVADKYEENESDNKLPDDYETRAKPGDIWQLGSHRLMCGDSTNPQHVSMLFAGATPNIMITDPPYGVEYEAGWRAEAKGTKKTKREESSNLKNDNIADWYEAYSLFTGNIAYVWHASSFTDVVMNGLKKCGFEIKAQIIWNKSVHALSRSDYHWKHEPCWYAVKAGANHSWVGDRKQMTIWDIGNVMHEKDAGEKTAHPTQKPVKIYIVPIENHTQKNDVIYDPFAGSGTAIIACEKTGRVALSMELDPKYVDVILTRWENLTGNKAELINKPKE